MPLVTQGKFSPIPAAVAALVDAQRVALGLQRVSIGSVLNGVDLPEVAVTFDGETPVTADQTTERQRPALRYHVPIVAVLLVEYAEPGGTPSAVEKAVLLMEKVVDLIMASPSPTSAARDVRFVGLTVTEAPDATTPTYAVEARFIYEVVLAA